MEESLIKVIRDSVALIIIDMSVVATGVHSDGNLFDSMGSSIFEMSSSIFDSSNNQITFVLKPKDTFIKESFDYQGCSRKLHEYFLDNHRSLLIAIPMTLFDQSLHQIDIKESFDYQMNF